MGEAGNVNLCTSEVGWPDWSTIASALRSAIGRLLMYIHTIIHTYTRARIVCMSMYDVFLFYDVFLMYIVCHRAFANVHTYKHTRARARARAHSVLEYV